MSDRLQARYTGVAAQKYDERRKSSPRYKVETESFARYFERVRPRLVIDCPFGTGRWLNEYDRVGCQVVAVDLSTDMLAAAKEKVSPAMASNISFVTASAFDYDFAQFTKEQPDLLVCTRFLNWFDTDRAKAAVANLSLSGAKWAIFGASVRPSNLSLLKRWRMRYRLKRENLPREKASRAIQYVHDEGSIVGAFRESGWEVIEKNHIFSSPTRENYFWLLRQAR